jgi:PAS domain S-box-containing protein
MNMRSAAGNQDRVDGTADGRQAFARFACWLCLIAPALVTVLIVSQGQFFRLAGPAVFFLTGGTGLWLLRGGRNDAAFRVLTFGSWLATVVALSYTGGIKGNAVSALPIIIMFSAWLAGVRAMLLLGGLTIAVLFGYALIGLNDLLPIRFEPPLLQRAFILSIIIVAATALGYFAARTLLTQMKALADSRGELEIKVASLARREAELSLLAESVPAMIVRFDSNQVCRFTNAAYARFHGRPPEAIMGRTAREIIGEAAYADIADSLRKVLSGEQVRLTVSRSNAAGEARTLALDLVPDFGQEGRIAGWYALIRDVTESERVANALRHIIEGTARATGTAFFRALARNLAQATGLRCAMVAEVLPDRRHARALAYWTGEDFREGAVYLLADAPCQRVMEDGEACFPDRVAELFPLDKPLAAQGIRGYYGVRLEASDDTPLGVLVVMDGAPIRNRSEIASLVSVFATRAAAELERIRADMEQQRAEEARRAALERFEAIFQSTPNVAIQGFDAKGTVMHWNRASETMYGISASEAVGKPIQSLLHTPETAAEFETVVAGICESGAATEPGEWPIPLRDGREIWVVSTMFPVFSDGILVEIFCMDVDITEMKRSAEEVRQLNVELEARVAARTAELAALNQELEAFSYSMSHDLRAPLRSIDGFGRLLEQDYADRIDDTGKDYILRMRRAAQRLAQLIDDLLDLTRIDRAEIRPEEVDLSALALEIIEELRQGAPQRRVAVSIADGVRARGDSRLLRIALQNLLDNAWKYSGKVEDARIEFGCDASDGRSVCYVRDNGTGFDMAYADKLFTPFQRLHNPRDFEGTGVGLASVARVIKRHGGRIWAESAPGKGATFLFTLSPDSDLP